MNSDLQSNYIFRSTNDLDPSNSATIIGAETLFLEGIVPENGSLALTPREETYWDYRTSFYTSDFKFDFNNSQITIPVNRGNITFIYGSEPVSYVFPEDGVYNIQFSNDWNKILNVEKVRDLRKETFSSPSITIITKVMEPQNLTDISGILNADESHYPPVESRPRVVKPSNPVILIQKPVIYPYAVIAVIFIISFSTILAVSLHSSKRKRSINLGQKRKLMFSSIILFRILLISIEQ